MSNTIGHSTLAQVAAIALLALLPAAATAQSPLSLQLIQEPSSAATASDARVSASKMSGLFVWALRRGSAERPAAESLPLARFAGTAQNDSETTATANLFEFGNEHPADRGRLDHAGNLFRIDF